MPFATMYNIIKKLITSIYHIKEIIFKQQQHICIISFFLALFTVIFSVLIHLILFFLQSGHENTSQQSDGKINGKKIYIFNCCGDIDVKLCFMLCKMTIQPPYIALMQLQDLHLLPHGKEMDVGYCCRCM